MRKDGKRKRYLLLSSETEVTSEGRREVVRLLLQLYPDLNVKKMVWVNGSLIFRTDNRRLPEMKIGLTIRVGEAVFVPKSASGSISKLKRAASCPDRGEWSSSSPRNTSKR